MCVIVIIEKLDNKAFLVLFDLKRSNFLGIFFFPFVKERVNKERLIKFNFMMFLAKTKSMQ